MNGYHVKAGEITEASVGDLLAERRRTKKAAKLAQENWQHQVMPFEDLLARQASRKPEPPTEEPPMQVVQTALDGASKDVQRHELRKAAGAEGTSPPRAMPDIVKLIQQAEERDAAAMEPFEPTPLRVDLSDLVEDDEPTPLDLLLSLNDPPCDDEDEPEIVLGDIDFTTPLQAGGAR